jgi:hypothetical protein
MITPGMLQGFGEKPIPEQFRHTTYEIVIPDLADDPMMQNLTIVEFTVTDSLLSPSTQTTVSVQDMIHTEPIKNLDKYAGKKVYVGAKRPILGLMGFPDTLFVEQAVYRVSGRKPMTDRIERYNLHFCDASLLVNSARRVSKSWLCDPPSAVVNDILTKCIGAPRIDIETCGPNRPYTAENIHPFQVLAQQADVALYGGDDPCFLHYMSTKDGGTHHFRSLKYLTAATPVFDFYYYEKGNMDVYANPQAILDYHFPCDFDLLSDIENGINPDGTENVSFLSFNPFDSVRTLSGVGLGPCGFGGALYDSGFTNKVTGPQAGTCEVQTENYMLRRQARLSLLDHDKMALQLVVPFNPNIIAGSVIRCTFPNKGKEISDDYGSGTYLVTTVSHTVKTNGIGTTTMDCVSRGVGLTG